MRTEIVILLFYINTDEDVMSVKEKGINKFELVQNNLKATFNKF